MFLGYGYLGITFTSDCCLVKWKIGFYQPHKCRKDVYMYVCRCVDLSCWAKPFQLGPRFWAVVPE